MSFISTTLVLPHLGQRTVHRISPESFTILTGRAFPQAGQTIFAGLPVVFLSIPPEIYEHISNNVQQLLRIIAQSLATLLHDKKTD